MNHHTQHQSDDFWKGLLLALAGTAVIAGAAYVVAGGML